MSESTPARRPFGGFLSILITLFLLGIFFFSIVLNFLLAGALAVLSDEQELTQNAGTFKVKVLENQGKGESKILTIPINGVIMEGADWDERMTTSSFVKRRLEQAAKDKNVKAVILKINSPGGAISTTEKIYQAILEYKEKTGNPVVAYLDDVAASGGYYLAVACDKIVAFPYGITGSIGVIMSFYQMQDLFENKLGIKEIVIKSGLHKDIGSAQRSMTDQEKEIFDGIIQEMYGRFLEVVKNGRENLAGLSEEELLNIADGRVYTGNQALEKGLVDQLGSFADAFEEATKLAGNLTKDKTELIKYESRRPFIQELLDTSVKAPKLPFENFMENIGSPRFYYMWKTSSIR